MLSYVFTSLHVVCLKMVAQRQIAISSLQGMAAMADATSREMSKHLLQNVELLSWTESEIDVAQSLFLETFWSKETNERHYALI